MQPEFQREVQRFQANVNLTSLPALSSLGFYDGKIDGDYGPGTAKALNQYYWSNGGKPPVQISMETILEIERAAYEASVRQNERSTSQTSAPSFDCSKASTRVENLVCDNARLAELDSEMASAYKTALRDSSWASANKRIRRQQKEWLTQRNRCESKRCLRPLYRDRISALRAEVSGSGPEKDSANRPDTVPGLPMLQAPAKVNSLELSKGGSWIVIASRQDLGEAKSFAESYARTFPSTTISLSKNGWYVIAIGWADSQFASQLKSVLVRTSLVPDDTFLSTGQQFRGPVWVTSPNEVQSSGQFKLYGMFRSKAPTWLDQIARDKAFAPFDAVAVRSQQDASSRLGLRRAPRQTDRLSGAVWAGAPVQRLGSKSGWTKIRILNGEKGWLPSTNVKSLEEILESEDTVASNESKDEAETTSPKLLDPSDPGMTAAKQLMSDAAEFLRVNPNTINLVELAKSISELKAAIESSERTKVETATVRLGDVLTGTDKYGQFAEEKRKARQAKLIEELGTAVKEARQNSAIMRRYIARNATAEASARFAGLLEQLDLALKSPELSSLRDLNAEFSEAVSRYRLQDEIKEASQQASSGQTRNSEPESQQTQQEIAKTEKNSFLLDGDLGDILFLYNSSGEAPNVIRNLRGDIIFEKPFIAFDHCIALTPMHIGPIGNLGRVPAVLQ